MDLDAYISRYSGETRLQRLLFIGKNAQNKTMATQAYNLAEAQMKQTGNVHSYKELFQGSHPRFEGLYNAEWVSETLDANRAARELLESRLSSAQSHLNKESIRTAYLALAQHDRDRGELAQSLRSVLRSREYCTNRAQTGQVCLWVLELGLYLKHHGQVRDYVHKAGNSAGSNQVLKTKLAIASGLERMAEGQYKEAALKFTSVAATTSAHTQSNAAELQWDCLIAPEDVASYAALLSLATSSRKQILELAGLCSEKGALGEELLPPLRQALLQFGRAQYQACLSTIETVLPQLQLDIYLSPHLKDLLDKIREKCILEHLKPYECVSLTQMAREFHMDLPALQVLLRKLILNKSTPVRMNCRTMTLTRTAESNRTTAKVEDLGRRLLDDSYAMIIRLACLENDLQVTDQHKTQRRQRRGPRNVNVPDYEAVVLDDDDDDDDDDSSGDMPMVDVSAESQQANPEDLY